MELPVLFNIILGFLIGVVLYYILTPDFKKPNPTKSKSPKQRKKEKDKKKMGIEPVNLNEDLYDY